MKQTLYWETFDSPLGKITVCCSSQGLRDLLLGSAVETERAGGPLPEVGAFEAPTILPD